MHSDSRHSLSTRWILTGHIVATALQTIAATLLVSLMPLIARLRFGAGEWQTFLVTAALPTFLCASIFWNELLVRISLKRYLAIYWAVGILPLVLLAAAQDYRHLLACHVLAAVGLAGWSPVNGELLKRFYPDDARGRMFGLLSAPTMLAGIVTVLAAGRWLTADGEAFRIFLPITAALQIACVVILVRLAAARPAGGDTPLAPHRGWRDALLPVVHLRRTLREDRTFALFEAAFMTYGAAYMICEALLPVLVTKKLGLHYDQVAEAALAVQRGATLLMVMPMGWVLDRLGAVRTSALSFAALAAYPLGLMLAGGQTGLAVASAIFGVAMAGVLHGWMLGPVALAATPQKVSHYVAIHTTLVGIRGVLFQGLGMLLYEVTGRFAVPLALAAAAFLWAAWQMWRLRHALVARRRPAYGAAAAAAETAPDAAAARISGAIGDASAGRAR